MPAKKDPQKDSIRVLAAKAGLSLGQINRAMKQGIDPTDLAALKKYRDATPPRIDSRSELSRDPSPKTNSGNPESLEMSIDEIQRALRAKGISATDATILKKQLEGLKIALAVQKEQNKLIQRVEVEAAFTKIGAALNAAFRVAESEIPQRCNGLPLSESRPITKEIMREIQAKLADSESEFWKDYPEIE